MTICFRILSKYINNILLEKNLSQKKLQYNRSCKMFKELTPKYVMFKKSSQKYNSLQCLIILINEFLKYSIHIKIQSNFFTMSKKNCCHTIFPFNIHFLRFTYHISPSTWTQCEWCFNVSRYTMIEIIMLQNITFCCSLMYIDIKI